MAIERLCRRGAEAVTVASFAVWERDVHWPTWSLNNAECTLYSNKITINRFGDWEWSWHLPGDLIVINSRSRQALCGASCLSDNECQLPPEYLWLYSHHLTFYFSNIRTKQLLPTFCHRMSRPFCGHVQMKNCGKMLMWHELPAQRSRSIFVGWQHWPTYISCVISVSWLYHELWVHINTASTSQLLWTANITGHCISAASSANTNPHWCW